MLTVYAISGGSGETAERVTYAALSQFENAPGATGKKMIQVPLP